MKIVAWLVLLNLYLIGNFAQAQEHWVVALLESNVSRTSLTELKALEVEKRQQIYRDSLTERNTLRLQGRLESGGEFWLLNLRDTDQAISISLASPMVKASQLNPILMSVQGMDGKLCFGEVGRSWMPFILIHYERMDYGIKMTNVSDDGGLFLDELEKTDKLLLSIKGYGFEGMAIVKPFEVEQFLKENSQVKENKIQASIKTVYFPSGQFCD